MRIPFFGRKPSRRGSYSDGGWLKPETKRAILGIFMLFVAALIVLSFFEAAGPTGKILLAGLKQLFGVLVYPLPIGLGLWGFFLVRPLQEGFSRWRMVGIALLVVGILGLFHIVGVSTEEAYQHALDGKGGGLIGFGLSFPLTRAFSPIASLLIFLAATLIGFFLTFNLSPSEAWAYLLAMIPGRRAEEEGEETDDMQAEDGEETSSPLPTFRVNRMRLASKGDPQQLQLAAAQQQKEEEAKQRVAQQVKAANKTYQPPSIDILHASVGRPDSGNVNENKKLIQTTLEKFGIPVQMGKVSVGPTVTQYTLRPDEGVKLARITALQNDLALALAAHPLRIEAPIPNTNLVGIEIPNKDVSLVRLKDLIISKEFRNAQSPLTIVLGKDVAGRPHAATIEKMPHLLIAGATGSGKSIFINTLILSLLYRNSPALCRFILIDPKRVELSVYNNVPHLLTPVITEPDKTVNALKWATREMERRYRVLSESGARNLMSFNSNNPEEAMPNIVIVIDELADLMATHARDVEGMIVRLSQMARAIGIHLVLATQRPSVNVITGLIKANIPTRVAFNVASQVDSRTILDGAGAEKLLGSGDMLYLASDRGKPLRLQGSFVSEEEVHQVVKDIQDKNPMQVEYDESVISSARDGGGGGGGSGESGDDPLFEEAKRLVTESGKASASLLQRRLRVGYARAARLLDILESNGVIGAQAGNKPREILSAGARQDSSYDEGFGGRVDEETDPGFYDDSEPEGPAEDNSVEEESEEWER
jgi:DNA segregation ATPase FtsK/SpoIIIE, S-DNA-T family